MSRRRRYFGRGTATNEQSQPVRGTSGPGRSAGSQRRHGVPGGRRTLSTSDDHSRGEFDVANAPLLRAAFEGLFVGPFTSIVVDVAAVSFIDGAAERMLLEAERSAARRRVLFQRRGHSHAFGRLRR